MNITLSADENLVEKTREYASRHGTTMNQMIRRFMKKTAGELSGTDAADEFKELAMHHSGEAAKDFRFNREDIHRRSSY